MKTRKPSSRAQRILDHHRNRGRLYPTARYWERFFLMLEEEAERRGKSPPPAPLVATAESSPKRDDRMQCLDDQVAWADRNFLLHRVQMFFDALPPSGWTRSDR